MITPVDLTDSEWPLKKSQKQNFQKGGFLATPFNVEEVSAAWPVRDIPIFYPILEKATHHLWSTIRGDVFRYVPCGT